MPGWNGAPLFAKWSRLKSAKSIRWVSWLATSSVSKLKHLWLTIKCPDQSRICCGARWRYQKFITFHCKLNALYLFNKGTKSLVTCGKWSSNMTTVEQVVVFSALKTLLPYHRGYICHRNTGSRGDSLGHWPCHYFPTRFRFFSLWLSVHIFRHQEQRTPAMRQDC